MFKIYKGGEYFYQWDIGQRLVVEDETIIKVHFCNRTGDCALSCSVYEEDGLRLVNVPNILLQSTNNVRVYGCIEEGDDICFAKEMQIFRVIARNKPEEYVYTEDDIKNWDSLETRISALEEQLNGSNGSSGSNGKSAYEIALDNGFEGTEAEWLESLKGEDGYTPVKGTDYWTEVDIAEIKAYVDNAILGGEW